MLLSILIVISILSFWSFGLLSVFRVCRDIWRSRSGIKLLRVSDGKLGFIFRLELDDGVGLGDISAKGDLLLVLELLFGDGGIYGCSEGVESKYSSSDKSLRRDDTLV